mgnify:CR=1 FL=1
MRNDKLVLLDTNILVYGHQEQSEFHARSRSILKQGFVGKIPVCLCPQVCIEKYLKSSNVRIIHPGEETWEYTLSLLKRRAPKGMKVFDLQLIATMISNDVSRIYTFNRDDFVPFPELEVLTP